MVRIQHPGHVQGPEGREHRVSAAISWPSGMVRVQTCDTVSVLARCRQMLSNCTAETASFSLQKFKRTTH